VCSSDLPLLSIEKSACTDTFAGNAATNCATRARVRFAGQKTCEPPLSYPSKAITENTFGTSKKLQGISSKLDALEFKFHGPEFKLDAAEFSVHQTP